MRREEEESASLLPDLWFTVQRVGKNHSLSTNAVLCRTKKPNGAPNNSGCNLGSDCRPVCDANNPCSGGQRCCSGCRVSAQCCGAGDCCGNNCCTGSQRCRERNGTRDSCCQPGNRCTSSFQCQEVLDEFACGGNATCQNGTCCLSNGAECLEGHDNQCCSNSCTAPIFAGDCTRD